MNSIEEILDDFIDEYLRGQRRLLRLKKSRLSQLFFMRRLVMKRTVPSI